MCVCVYRAECPSQAVKRRWILQENPVAPGSVGVAVLQGSACSPQPAGTQSHCDTELGPGFKGPCWASASPHSAARSHCSSRWGPTSSASASALWGGPCTRVCGANTRSKHSDHTCVTERPLAWIGPVFWLKSYDCPAAFESCDITVSNSYIYMYIDTTTS